MEAVGTGTEHVILLWYHLSEFYRIYHQRNPASAHVFHVSLTFPSLPGHAEIQRNNIKSISLFVFIR